MAKTQKSNNFPGFSEQMEYLDGCLRLVLHHPATNTAVQFIVMTAWDTIPKDNLGYAPPLSGPLPADVGYHSPHPMYEGQTPREDCNVIEGTCYYDGSGLAALSMFRVLIERGSRGVFQELAMYWSNQFGDQPWVEGKMMPYVRAETNG